VTVSAWALPATGG